MIVMWLSVCIFLLSHNYDTVIVLVGLCLSWVWFPSCNTTTSLLRKYAVSIVFFTDEYDVIILGGGMAGVSAAQTLVKKGITNFIIIEGKDVIGGRMRAQQFGGITINTGAVWVQGTGNGKNPV